MLPDEKIIHSIILPEKIFKNIGGLKISSSSTILNKLYNCFMSLYDYEFSCSEQISSRLISIINLNKFSEYLKTDKIFPGENEILSNLKNGYEKLISIKKKNDTFGLWNNESKSYSFLTIHCIHALIILVRDPRLHFTSVDNTFMSSLFIRLLNIEDILEDNLNEKTSNTIIAYSLYVLSLFGTNIEDRLLKLFDKVKEDFSNNITFEGLCWLMCTFLKFLKVTSKQIEITISYLYKEFENKTIEKSFLDYYGNGICEEALMLHSNKRTKCVVLEFLCDLLNKIDVNDIKVINYFEKLSKMKEMVSKFLLDQFDPTTINNTQENVFFLIAFNSYIKKLEDPNFILQNWLEDEHISTHLFKTEGNKMQFNKINMDFIKMEDLFKIEMKTKNLYTKKIGTGPCYLSNELEYLKENLFVGKFSEDIKIKRFYKKNILNNDENLDIDQKENCNKIKCGEKVKIIIILNIKSVKYHLAIVDYIPSCFEILNDNIKNMESVEEKSVDENEDEKNTKYMILENYYNYIEKRDDKYEIFIERLEKGKYKFEYYCNVTTKGYYHIPSAKVEEMYNPKKINNTDSSRIICY